MGSLLAAETTPAPARADVDIPINTYLTPGGRAPATTSLVVPGLGAFARKALTESPDGVALLFVATPSAQSNAKYNINLRDTLLNVTVVFHPKVTLFEPPIRPRDGVYAESRNGHIHYGDRRLRLWGTVRPQTPNTETGLRIANMGFIAVRLWGPRNTAFDEKTGEYLPFKPGDGSGVDEYDQIFAACKKAGLFVMSTGPGNSSGSDNIPTTDNADWLKGEGANWPEWVKAAADPIQWVFNFAITVTEFQGTLTIVYSLTP